jgi:mono/diheme cytochrome c family protein
MIRLHLFLSVTAVLGCSVPATIRAAETPAATPEQPPRFTPQVEEFVKNFKPGGQDFAGQASVLSPEESVRRFVLPAGYGAELVASEPAVRQPIDLRFDERGRLWVVQYLQYPFPAGVTITGYDQYLRAEFDRVPPPPPRHTRGADKISIFEDRDGDGTFETQKTFLEGLNLATSIEFGRGGVWVMHSPHLLFYPDRNGDDVPDGDPEVHLSGFGLEDTHSLAMSLHMGPDGWLYGSTGSTTNLDVQGVRLLGQGIWRYHPDRKIFEVFAEGGGNTVSLEFDQFGRAYSGTNYGGTRGLHYAQGATYVKGWTKHGPAMNPFIFGFFEHMTHEGYSPRFPQAFLLYEGGALPALEGQIVAGMSLTNRVQASRLKPQGSTFRTVDSDALITTEDKTFRPVDVEQGPDGAIYIADWTDVRLSHLNPKDTWDKTNGRIVRVTTADAPRFAARDLRTLPTSGLIALLGHANRELREHARRLLSARPEPIAATLRAIVERNEAAALEAFWVLNLRGESDEASLRGALQHPNAHVRRWAVRLLGDTNSVSGESARALSTLAAKEPDVEVRSQLASSAKRLPPAQALPIVRALLTRDEDVADKHLPLLLWWALEGQAEKGREELIALVRDPAVWAARMFREHLAERLGQRFAADQGPRKHYTLKQGVYSEWIIDRAPEYLRRNLEQCGRLLEAAPGIDEANLLVNGMARGLTGPRVDDVPLVLTRTIAQLWAAPARSAALVVLAAKVGNDAATAEAIARMQRAKLDDADQALYLELFASTSPAGALPIVAGLVRSEKNEAKLARYLTALGGFADGAPAVLERFPTLSTRLKATAQRMLCERPAWALVMLEAIAAGKFDPGVISSSNVALLRGHRHARIDSLLTSYQNRHSEDPAQRAAQQLFEAGKTAYALSCAPCHQELGEGRVGLAPALVGSRWLGASDDVLARIVLHGKENPGRGMIMPPWGHLEDAQIAAILTFVRREFGNQPAAVSAAAVTRVRASTGDRKKAWSDAELDALGQPLSNRNDRRGP